MEIVGVSKDARYRSLYKGPGGAQFLPVYQHPRGVMRVLGGTRGRRAAVMKARAADRAGGFRRGVRRKVGEEKHGRDYWGRAWRPSWP